VSRTAARALADPRGECAFTLHRRGGQHRAGSKAPTELDDAASVPDVGERWTFCARGDAWQWTSREAVSAETSLPGVFAAGDVRSGSIKRVASAVGEGSMAVRLVHQHLADVGE
jgi:thioredoxin reductase